MITRVMYAIRTSDATKKALNDFDDKLVVTLYKIHITYNNLCDGSIYIYQTVIDIVLISGGVQSSGGVVNFQWIMP